MKKVKYSFVIIIILFIITNINAQNYFDLNNKKDIQVPWEGGTIVTIPIYFGFQEVSTSFLNLIVISNQRKQLDSYGNGAWIPNNGGGGSFGYYISFFEESQHPPGVINIYGNVLVNLRSGITKKDYVIARGNGLQVHWNSNDSITGVKQLITGLNPIKIESGSFNREDNTEDVAITDGSNIKIFKNLSNGSLETSPYNFSAEARKFKLRQINDKADGYIQNNPADRTDLIVLDSILTFGTITI